MARTKKAKRRKKLSLDEKRQRRLQRNQRRELQKVFETAGFRRVDAIADREFEFDGSRTDFDDAFVSHNVIALVEYTISAEGFVSDHIKNKKIIYDKILADPQAFFQFLRSRFPTLVRGNSTRYTSSQYEIRIVYCSHNRVKPTLRKMISEVCVLDDTGLKYFKHLADVIRASSTYEVLSFLRVDFQRYGPNISPAGGSPSAQYPASLLPEAHSRFPDGYKVVSFYVDPAALLQRAYVLRRDGWRDDQALYQRMIGKKKIEAVRDYLLTNERVFVNNIIVTLPDETRFEDERGHTIDSRRLSTTGAVKIRIPNKWNSVGIIDGQHRVYSYYEGGANEAEVGELRRQQNLLATGIIYPPTITDDERRRFEATLFLEINANQTNAKSDLKQSIGLLIRPFEAESLAREVINVLNDRTNTPLGDKFERHFFDKGRLKTTSVVSYGIKPLVRPDAEKALFARWDHTRKDLMVRRERDDLRRAYIDFAANSINEFVSAAKSQLPGELWTIDPRQKNRLLNPTTINVLLVCMRRVLEARKSIKFASVSQKFEKLTAKDLRAAHSSQYTVYGRALFEKFF